MASTSVSTTALKGAAALDLVVGSVIFSNTSMDALSSGLVSADVLMDSIAVIQSFPHFPGPVDVSRCSSVLDDRHFVKSDVWHFLDREADREPEIFPRLSSTRACLRSPRISARCRIQRLGSLRSVLTQRPQVL